MTEEGRNIESTISE